MTFDEVQSQIVAAFDEVPHPDFAAIPILGCCEDNADRYEVYCHRTWQEFCEDLKEQLASGGRKWAADSSEFFALPPIAFHYFTPALLIASLNYCAFASHDSLRFTEAHGWLDHFAPNSRKTLRESITAERFVLFTAAQKKAVAAALRLFNELHLAVEHYEDRWVSAAIEQWESK